MIDNSDERIIGIDPGLSGAWAILNALGHLIAVGDMPVAGDGAQRAVSGSLFGAELGRWRPKQAVVERVGAMPTDSRSGAFKFGRSVGVVEGAIGALLVPIMYVAPGVWKKHYGLAAEKEAARQRAIETWPDKADLFARKKDHGRAEAALIGLWGIIARNATRAD